MRRSSLLALVAVLVAAPAARAIPVAKAELTGKLLKQDSAEKLLRFLGLVPGQEAGDRAALAARIEEALERLTYVRRALDIAEIPGGLDVHLEIEPAQLVRHVKIYGNWPIFDEDIKRRMSLRPGTRLPPEPERTQLLEQEAERIREFLFREGYFAAEVRLGAQPTAQPEWMSLRVDVSRGPWFHLREATVDGASAFTPREFLSRFSSWLPWWLGRLKLDDLREDARNMELAYRDRGYPAARVIAEFDPSRDLVGADSARLRVRVTEKARMELRFSGNHHIGDRQLTEKVTIFTSGSYDDLELDQSAREIARFYQTEGFLEARVTSSRERTAETEKITFTVDEGPSLKVREVEIVPEPGAPSLGRVEEDALRRAIETRPFPRLGSIGLGGGGFVTVVQLQQDTAKIVGWERDAGCPDARARGEIARSEGALGRLGVLAAEVAANEDPSEDLWVRFSVDKGRCERLDALSVRFAGTHSRSVADLSKVIGIEGGRPYVGEQLQAARKRVIDWYAARGHPYATIAPPHFDWDETHTSARVTLTIDEGPEVRFGEIIIRGNFKTIEWAILRNLPFKTGDLFDVNKIAAAERNLQTHAIFNGVRVIPYGISSGTVNPVPILIEVQQERYDDWGALLLNVGYSTDVGLLVSPGYLWGNVFGGGGSAELRGEAAFDFSQTPSWSYTSTFYRRLALSLRYVHPHFIWPALRAEIVGFLRKESTVRLGEIDSEGVSLTGSYVFSPKLRAFARYELTSSNLLSLPVQRLPSRNDESDAISDNTRTGKLTLGAVFDSRLSFEGVKNPLMPVEGTLLAASGAIATRILGGTADFLLFSAQYQQFVPAGKSLTLMVHLRGDWGIPLDGRSELPSVDRLYAGGDVATRGFATDMLRTEVIPSTLTQDIGLVHVVPRGGNVRLLGTVELQLILTRIAGFPLAGAVFFDVGALFDAFDQIRKDDVRASVGITALRLLTPVGPISLEYAYPLTQTVAEQDWKSQPWYRHWPGLIHFNWGIPILR